MVGSRKAAVPTSGASEQMSYLRKIRKPMVEKQRRERMNQSIEQLKSLIAQTIKQNTTPMTRVDKADILELTVFHLTQLQQQQQSVTLATQTAAYQAGYRACARETVSYLSNTGMTHVGVTSSLERHLNRTIVHHNRDTTSSGILRSQHAPKHILLSDRRSTPQRQSDCLTRLHDTSFPNCSPIQNGDTTLPELTSSFISGALNTSSFLKSSNASISSGSDSSGYVSDSVSYHSDDINEKHASSGENSRTSIVAIGDGKENEIGHVIKEVPWRPF